MNSILEGLKKLNESTLLLEYDRKDLRKWAGDELTQQFFSIRNRVQAPENDLGYWIKKGDLEAFKDFVNGWVSGETKSKTQKKKEERIAGAELILDEKGWKVYHVTTYEAARQLGSNTTWCITGRYNGYEEKGKYYFDNYIKNYNLDGGYYFIFDTMNKDHDDIAKYCAGVNTSNKLVFLYNGMQDSDITYKGIPNITPDRRIQLIPGIEIEFYDVYKIEDGVLVKLNDKVRNAVVPDGVVEIKKLCFYENTVLQSVSLPASLTKIGKGAFANCSNLREVTFPAGANIALGDGVFLNCDRLAEVDFKNSVKEIPAACFAYCDSLQNVSGLDNIESIAPGAFKGVENVNLLLDGPTNKAVIDFANDNKNVDAVNRKDGSIITDYIESTYPPEVGDDEIIDEPLTDLD